MTARLSAIALVHRRERVTVRGRPPLPPEERRAHRIEIRVSEAEARELAEYAAREDVQHVAEAIRDAALRAARWLP